MLSFVQIEGRWTVWDVKRGADFRDARGRLASAEELPLGVRPLAVPVMLRARKQMPGPRLLFELQQAFGRHGRSAGGSS